MLLTTMLLAMAQAAEPAPASTTATKSKEDKLVCQLEENTFSRIRAKKICLKQSEWDAMARETERDLRKSSNQRSIPPNP